MPILGYSDDGYFSKDSLPGGLMRWFKAVGSYIKNLKANNVKQTASVAYQWSTLSCDQPVLVERSPLKSTEVNQCSGSTTPPGGTPTDVVYTYGPLLKTTWGQGCTYNDDLPAFYGPCNHAFTGCVATAMAQIMAYWKYPSTYNWSQMPANQGSSETQSLMFDIGRAVHMTYGGYNENGSYASGSNIGGSLVGVFGYSSAKYDDSYSDTNDFQTVVNNIKAKQPVILIGCAGESTNWLGMITDLWDCHAWVCDGYMETYYNNPDGTIIGGSSMFHMNWGWYEYNFSTTNPDYNGWFVADDWTVKRSDRTFDFQYGLQMVYNIHP
jgi:hypothetical protein